MIIWDYKAESHADEEGLACEVSGEFDSLGAVQHFEINCASGQLGLKIQL